MQKTRLVLAGLAISIWACDGNNTQPPDGSLPIDADTTADAATDAAPSDAPSVDSATIDAPTIDAPRIDAAHVDALAIDAPTIDAALADAPHAYRHTIVIDGTNDFAAGDTFATTSAGYTAYVSWDDTTLYLGLDGPDVDSGSATRWVQAYFDTTAGGAAQGVTYNTQQPAFPNGFLADAHLRWKADNAFTRLMTYNATWADTGANPSTFQQGTFVEIAVPLADLGAPSRVGVVLFMMNEEANVEWTYAGLYADAFTDGYNAATPILFYLDADFVSASPPNDASRKLP